MENIFSLNAILIIFIFLFPGIIIRKAYYSGKFSKQFNRGQFSEKLFASLFWGIVNFIIASSLLPLFLKFKGVESVYKFFYNLVVKVVTFDITKGADYLSNISFTEIISLIIFFIFGLFILPFMLGSMGFKIVRKLKLDLKLTSFTFSNHWHYFFKGEIIDKTDTNKISKQNINFDPNEDNITRLDVLTLEGNSKYLYKGILLDYNLKESDEDLDSIILYEPMKKKYIDEDDKKKKGFESIPGNFILIPYSNILNLNVTFRNPKDIDIHKKDIDTENRDAECQKDGQLYSSFVILIICIFICLTSSYANGISYLRYSIGLIISIILLLYYCMILHDLFTEFKYKRLIRFIVFLVMGYIFYVYIFNIDIFNPIELFLEFIMR